MQKKKNTNPFVAIEITVLVLIGCAVLLHFIGKLPIPPEYSPSEYPWLLIASGACALFFLVALMRNMIGFFEKKPVSKVAYISTQNASSQPKQNKAQNPETEVSVVQHAAVSGQTVQLLLDELNSRPQGVEELLASIVFFMRKNFDAYSALGFIYNPTTNSFILNAVHTKSTKVIEGIEIAGGDGIVGRIATERRSFLSGDIQMYGEKVMYYREGEVVYSVLAVPVVSDEKELLGALVIDSNNKRAFTDTHKDIMRRFSGLAAALIINARMRIYQQRTARQFKVFYENSQQLTTALTTDDVFNILFATIGSLVSHNRIMTISLNPQTNMGRIVRVSGTKTDVEQGAEFTLGGGLYGFSYQKKKIVNIGNYGAGTQQYYRFDSGEAEDTTLVSLIIIPILDNDMRCLGLLSIEGDRQEMFSGEIETLLSTLMGNASVAIARALLYQKMEKLATTDGLTGLPNHRYFQDQLTNEMDRARRYSRHFSLLLMDIDHFKKFNDTYGHTIGDLVLREIAVCIRSAIRSSDLPARYGGEEFVVILAESSVEGAMATAERIRKTVEERRIMHGDTVLTVTVSLGCATCPPHIDDKQFLVNMADTALYYSKEHGRNQVNLYNPSMTMEKKK